MTSSARNNAFCLLCIQPNKVVPPFVTQVLRFVYMYCLFSFIWHPPCTHLESVWDYHQSSVSYQFWNRVTGSLTMSHKQFNAGQKDWCCFFLMKNKRWVFIVTSKVWSVFFFMLWSMLCVSRVASWLFHLHRVRNGSSPLFKPPVTHCIFSPCSSQPELCLEPVAGLWRF